MRFELPGAIAADAGPWLGPVQVAARAGEGGKLFGSVTASDVADAVQIQTGIELDRRKVVLDEPIRELGDAQVQVRLPAEVVVAVAVLVVAE